MVVIIIFFRIWIPTEFSLSITWRDADRLVVKILYSTQRTQIFMLCFTFREIPSEKTNLFKSEIIVRSMSYFLLMWQKHTMSSRIQGHLYSGVCRYKYIHKQPRQRVCFFSQKNRTCKVFKNFLSARPQNTLVYTANRNCIFNIYYFRCSYNKASNIPFGNMSKTISLFILINLLWISLFYIHRLKNKRASCNIIKNNNTKVWMFLYY